jgi:hypothetical protein
VVLQSNEEEASRLRQNQNSRNVHHLGVDGDITSDGHTTETDLGTVNVGWLPMRSCNQGVASGLGELVPDVEPLTVVLVDLLTTDLNLDGGDESVTRESTQRPWKRRYQSP